MNSNGLDDVAESGPLLGLSLGLENRATEVMLNASEKKGCNLIKVLDLEKLYVILERIHSSTKNMRDNSKVHKRCNNNNNN